MFRNPRSCALVSAIIMLCRCRTILDVFVVARNGPTAREGLLKLPELDARVP